MELTPLLQTVLNTVSEAVVVTDLQGMILHVNPAYETLTGYAADELMGKSAGIVKGGTHDERFYDVLWDTLRAGKIWRGNFINRNKSGSVYTERAIITPVKDAAGEITMYVGVKNDATAEREIEEQLRQARKMQSVGQLVGGVAHDFNNLVQVINGFAGIVRSKLEPGHAACENVEEIASAGAHAKELVQQLLLFSRREGHRPVDLNLNDEIGHLRKMLGRVLGEDIQMEFLSEPELKSVFADSSHIQQVVMNLCANARDAMPQGGVLVVQTENVSLEKDSLSFPGEVRPGEYVMLSVSDTGCGMDDETMAKVFEPFFTTKRAGEGTGLGLSTVYSIVKQSEGYVDLVSAPGKGAAFNIYLPASQPLAVFEPVVPDRFSIEDGVETILVVEDDAGLQKLAKSLLSEVGYTVLTAVDGIDGVETFAQHMGEIDLVLMDLMMPRMGGWEAMERIIAKRPSIRYLFVSGYSPDIDDKRFAEKNGLYLLSKPYTREELLIRVRDVLDEDLSGDAAVKKE
jgi:PAS domain S-box-containing protein